MTPPSRSGLDDGGRLRGVALVAATLLAMGALMALRRADSAFGPAAVAEARARAPFARLARGALGRSHGVHMRFALPGERIPIPLEVGGAPSALSFEWIPLGARVARDSSRLVAGTLAAPTRPGFYQLAVADARGRTRIDSLTLAVLVPFEAKQGTSLNGYRIGVYRGERPGRDAERPRGFLEVGAGHEELAVSAHMRVGDFITHDGQAGWPRYAAIDERVLDKLELVFDELARWRGGRARAPVEVDVHSGFRTPLYNRRVPRAAGDSRHQYGDAADVAVDADGDGRVDRRDVQLVALAVEIVEARHPDLAGGLGLYTTRGAAYAHIDARGRRARW